MSQKLSQNHMSELKETKKIKVVKPYPNPIYSPLGPQKAKKITSKLIKN